MNVQYLNLEGNPVTNVSSFKKSLSSRGFGIAEINVTDAEGTRHILKINPNYMGGGFAYFLTHTGMGRQQLIKTTLDELVKEGGIIETFLKDAGVVTSGGKRKMRKSRKAKRKTRKTRRR